MGGLGSTGLIVELGDLNGLLQPKWFCDSIYTSVLYICMEHKLHELHYLSDKEKVKMLSVRHLYQLILGLINIV